jgi:O-antigen/teichoic acid export membrane protein
VALVLTGIPDDAVDCMLAFSASNVFAAVVCLAGNPELRPRRVRLRSASALLRASVPTAVFAITSNGYSRVDTLLLAWLVGPAVAGVYGTAYRFVTTAVGLAGFIVATAAKRLGIADRAGERLVRVQIVGYAFVSTVAVAVAIGPMTQLTAGRRLSNAAGFLLATAVFPAVLALFFTQTTLLRGGRRSLMSSSLKVAAIAASLYPALIVWRGVEGAAVASVVVETAAAVFYRSVLRLQRVEGGIH